MLQAPDGSKVERYDLERTSAAYALIDADADCRCENCNNYRRAFDVSRLDSGLISACEILGIDLMKALEVSLLTVDANTSLALYYGHYPFFGTVIMNAVGPNNVYVPWWFSPFTDGTARIAQDAVNISFFIELPWVSTDPESARSIETFD